MLVLLACASTTAALLPGCHHQQKPTASHQQVAPTTPTTEAATNIEPAGEVMPPTTTEAAAATTEPTTQTAATPETSPTPTEPIAPAAGAAAAAAGTAAAIPTVAGAAASESPVTQPTAETIATTEPAPTTTVATTEPAFNPAPPTTNPVEIEADRLVAERLCAMAQGAIPSKVPSPDLWPPIWKEVAAILQTACKMDPSNPRLSRLLTDAKLQLHDTDGAIAALALTRKSAPTDEFAQIQTVDLYASKIETADAKVAYLKDILGKPAGMVPDAVRAHAGVVAAKLLLDRGQEQQAKNVLGEALRTNPLSGEGLRLQYDLLPQTTSSFERATKLVALLKANPAQPQYTEALADQLANSALVKESIPWYSATLSLTIAYGRPSPSVAVKFASESFIDGDAQTANSLVDNVLNADPSYPGAWFLKLAIIHSVAPPDQYTKVLQQARNALGNEVVDQVNKISPDNTSGAAGAKPTTRPLTSDGPYPLPDLRLVIANLNQTSASQQDKDALVEAISRLAMLEVYFAQDPDAGGKLVDVLKQMRPEDDPAIARLEGWLFLVQGKNDEAKQRFSGIAAQDPMATLGMVKLEPDKQAAASIGRKLIADYPSGLIGAILWDGLKPWNVKIVTGRQSDALRQVAEQFPMQWLHVIDQPQNFYAVHVDPLAVARDYGEPLLARLSIVNMTNADLTIGPDGVLKQDLWFNAQIKGIVEQNFVGTAFDRVAGPTVLRGRQMVTQVIRLDQGPLREFLEKDPSVAFEVYGSVVTNPTQGPKGGVGVGPAGYAVQFSKVFNRAAAATTGPAPQQAINDLANGTPTAKIDAMTLLNMYVRTAMSKKDLDDATKQKVLAMANMLMKMQGDPVPGVSALAGYFAARMIGGEPQTALIRELAQSDDWRHRAAALLVESTPVDVQKEIIAQLSADPEPCVRALARARADVLDVFSKLPPSATQPAASTEPSPAMLP
jgi:tetratricopeptide (TPR) repeat protein